jgi:hypothetical protein
MIPLKEQAWELMHKHNLAEIDQNIYDGRTMEEYTGHCQLALRGIMTASADTPQSTFLWHVRNTKYPYSHEPLPGPGVFAVLAVLVYCAVHISLRLKSSQSSRIGPRRPSVTGEELEGGALCRKKHRCY